MSKIDKSKEELPLEALMLECKKDKYKVVYAAVRWAREFKQKENLAEPIQHLMPRAMRDILIGKTTIKEIEKLPMITKVAPPPPPPAAPTITLNPSAADSKGE